MSVKLSALTELASQLQTADYTYLIRGGQEYKYDLSKYLVKNSGNETIAGIKTFSSSPIVPTPTTDMQPSTKKYVDDAIDALGVGDANGVATLDSTGKVPTAQMPPLVITDTFVVATEAAMLALTAEKGDIAKRTDYSPAKTFILADTPASTLSNWVEITVSTDVNTPTADQKAALAGNSGTPSATNPYATDLALVPLESLKEYDPLYPYALNEPCFYLGVPYKSLDDNNQGNTPTDYPLKWEVTGGGSSSTESGITFENGQLERAITGYVTYNDGASATPVDGTGGAPTITFLHNTTNPLVGLGDAILTKSATNCQGQGVSRDFTIDRGKVTDAVQIQFEYQTSTGYVDSDVGVFIYDVTLANLIPVSIQNLPSTYGSVGKFLATFIPSTSSQYRLCLHITSTNATTYTLEIDDIVVSQKQVAVGAAIGNWTSYTPSGLIEGLPGSWSTAQYERRGQTAHFYLKYTASGAGTSIFSLASSSVIPQNLTAINFPKPTVKVGNGGVGLYIGEWAGDDGNLYTSSGAALNATSGHTWKSGDYIVFDFEVQISQWASNINLASDFSEYASNNSPTANDITGTYNRRGFGQWGTFSSDMNVGTGYQRRIRFTQAIKWGVDKLQFILRDSGTVVYGQAEDSFQVAHALRGGINNYYGYGFQPVANDPYSVDVMFAQNGRIPLGSLTANGASWSDLQAWGWAVKKVSNGNMAEIPSIAHAEYNTPYNAFNTITTAQTLRYTTKVTDTHSAYDTSTGEYTAPIDGYYKVSLNVGEASGAVGTVSQLFILVDGIRKMTNYFLTQGSYCTHLCEKTVWVPKGKKISTQYLVSSAWSSNSDTAIAYITITWLGK